jgi:hypothetical protein
VLARGTHHQGVPLDREHLTAPSELGGGSTGPEPDDDGKTTPLRER